jgi:hypothetical protein
MIVAVTYLFHDNQPVCFLVQAWLAVPNCH